MDLIHEFLNVVFPIVAITAVILFTPPFLIYKLIKHVISIFKSFENLAGKVVLITGASSGIGEALAYEYASRGARLALVARREARVQAVAAKAVRLGSPDVIVIRADVSQVKECDRLVSETIDHFGQLDYLVNNAGVLRLGLFKDSMIEVSANRSIMDINFWGSVYCTQFALPHLIKSKGNIVVISSSGAFYSVPRMSFYNASKAAQISFFETLKSEFGSDIGVTIVTPGLIESEMTGDKFWSKSKLKGLPVESTEGCAKAIVNSACKEDMYLTEPSWCKMGVWLKMLYPQIMQKAFHLTLIHRPWTSSNKDS